MDTFIAHPNTRLDLIERPNLSQPCPIDIAFQNTSHLQTKDSVVVNPAIEAFQSNDTIGRLGQARETMIPAMWGQA